MLPLHKIEIRDLLLDEMEVGLAALEGPQFCKDGFLEGINISRALILFEDYERTLLERQAELARLIRKAPESPTYFRYGCGTGPIELTYEVIKAAEFVMDGEESAEAVSPRALTVAHRLIRTSLLD